jgi:hypothetical protein
LGNYDEGSEHELTLQLNWGGYAKWGWRVTLCAVHYESVFVEVDWMEGTLGCLGHKPQDEVDEYVSAYFAIHGYERVEFFMFYRTQPWMANPTK